MQAVITKVENPVYMPEEDIEKTFWNNWLLISNIISNKRGFEGGIVRYYSDDSIILFDKMEELEELPDKYGNCKISYIGDGKGKGHWLGGVLI